MSHFKNYEAMQTVSLFARINSDIPGDSTLAALAERSRTDRQLLSCTNAYRATGNRLYKEQLVCSSVAVRFEGGKAKEHVKNFTGYVMADFDHLPEDKVEELREKANADAHTLMSYVTVSGKGLRVIAGYELDATLPVPELTNQYKDVFLTVNEYYQELLGVPFDAQCKNATRLSILAYDPKAFYNPQAAAFTRQWITTNSLSRQQRRHEERVIQQKRRRELSAVSKLFDSHIAPMLERDGAEYAPGRHNDYVMRAGYLLNQYGVSLDVAVEWAMGKFADYDSTEQVVRSCYQRTEEHATLKVPRAKARKTDNGGYATVEEIKEFLGERYVFRRNVITRFIEYAPKPEADGQAPQWLPLCDPDLNSIWDEMSCTGVRVNVNDIDRIINSKFASKYHPLDSFLKALPKWTAGQPDYIGELASTVSVNGGDEAQERFALYLKKWLVGMVAGWVSCKNVNHEILVLIGKQGAYKTTWFNYLLPPELRYYFLVRTNSQRMTKDDCIAITENALICLEELDTMTSGNLNQLKSVVTIEKVKEREAYARRPEERPRIASFCGTGNNIQFLTDNSGNRRWLPFEVKSIRSPRQHPFNYTGIYSHAYALYLSGFKYWFEQDEIEELNEHNRAFEAPNTEYELVMANFRKPGPNESGQFWTASNAMQYIGENIATRLSVVSVGRAFSALGFERRKSNGLRGYMVIPRTVDEIKEFRKTLGLYSETE